MNILALLRRRKMFEVFNAKHGYTHSVGHTTLDAAIKSALKSGFACSIFKSDDPFTIVKWVFPNS